MKKNLENRATVRCLDRIGTGKKIKAIAMNDAVENTDPRNDHLNSSDQVMMMMIIITIPVIGNLIITALVVTDPGVDLDLLIVLVFVLVDPAMWEERRKITAKIKTSTSEIEILLKQPEKALIPKRVHRQNYIIGRSTTRLHHFPT